MSNYNSLILVEGKNDKGFVESLINFLDPKLNEIIEIKYMGGIDSFSNTIKSNIPDLKSKNITHLGIIVDQDEFSTKNRADFIINHLRTFIEFNEFDYQTLSAECNINGKRNLKLSLFLMSARNGKGELIDLLKEIKKRESVVSDCAIECLTKKEDSTSKELSDDWLHLYLKWDCSNSSQRKGSGNIGLDKENTKNRIEEIFDFNSENSVLNNLKTYLQQFKQQK